MSAQVCKNCTAAYSIGAPQCPQCGANNPRPQDDGPNGPVTKVRCGNPECANGGVARVVPLRLAAPGVVERTALYCAACDWAMEPVDDDENGDDDMPKSTVHEGPSNAADPPDEEGGEQSSPTPEADGTTSSTSSEKEQTSPETSGSAAPSRARTTGNRSKKAQTGSSTAAGTAGDQTAPTSDTDKD